MQRIFKKSYLILALIIAILFVTLIVFTMPAFCFAYTYDLNISLDANSKYCVNNGNFAYSKGNDLYVTTDNALIIKQNAFLGDLLDMAINNEYVVLLSQSSGTNNLQTYKYFDSATKKFLKEPTSVTIDFSTTQLDKILNGIEGLSVNDNKFFIRHTNLVKELQFNSLTPTLFHTADYSDIDNFFVWTIDTINYIIFQKDGKLFKNKQQVGINIDQSFTFSQSQVLSCDLQDDFIYANCMGGVYKIDKSNGDTTKLAYSENDSLPQGKIDVCLINGKAFIYFLDNSQYAIDNGILSIKMYSLINDTISYLNRFDSEIYKHPSTFDILTVAKLTKATEMFVSPKNKTVLKSFAPSDTLLLLTEKNDYYYATDGKGTFGYIDKNNISILTIGNISTFGKNAQALHNDTPIYKFPYAQSEQIDKIGIFTVLSITGFVGIENDVCLWGWCKISYVTNNNETKSGYIPLDSIAPYTNYTPPIVYKQAKIKADKLGSAVNVYLLPDSESEVLMQLTDGEIINLGQKFVNGDEWTKILLKNGEGYVQTKYLQQSGLTGLQIALITVSCVIFAAMTATLILLYIKKKKNTKPY